MKNQFYSPSMKPFFRLSHIHFSLILITLVFAVSNASNINKLAHWFRSPQELDLSGLSALLAFGLCFSIAFFLLFFAHRYLIKPAAMFLVFTSIMASYFIAKYNVAVDSSMVLDTLHTDPIEVSGLLSWQMLPWVVLLILPLFVLILKADIHFPRGARYLLSSVPLAFLFLGTGIALVYANYNSIHRAGNISNKYILYQMTPVNVLAGGTSILINKASQVVARYRKPIVIKARMTKAENLLVVLAIGESARQKNFSLYGYDRVNTNPLLQQVKGLHALNGKADIGTTMFALRKILRRGDYRLAAITRKLSIPTTCLSNFSLYDNCEPVRDIRTHDCGHDGKCYDEDVLPLLKSFLTQHRENRQKLAILHLGGGSHGPVYQKRFPPEFQLFKPQCLDADVNLCTRDALYNSYDNSLLYTDFVLKKLIELLDQSRQPYVLIYVSDHGESLFEGGRIFHGMPPGIDLPPEQAHVPLLVKSSIPVKIDERKSYPQPGIFDTVLDLLNIETEAKNPSGVFIKKNNLP